MSQLKHIFYSVDYIRKMDSLLFGGDKVMETVKSTQEVFPAASISCHYN